MSLKKVYTLVFGILLISGIFTLSVIMRPVWMKMKIPLNSTVYNINASRGITTWNRLSNTIENNFWLIPAVAAIIVLGYIFISMGEEEYISAGGYRR